MGQLVVQISGTHGLGKALGKISEKLAKANSVEIGFPKGSTERDGTSTPMVAAIQEFGAPGKSIPPRPFFRNMIAKQSSEWPAMLAKYLKDNGFDAEKSLGEIGEVIAADLRQSIIDTNEPALSPITLMLRGMRTQARYQNMPFGKLIVEAVKRVAAGKTNYGAATSVLVDRGAMLANIKSIVHTADEGSSE